MEWWQIAAMILGPSGTAYVGVKVSLNGLQRGQNRIFKHLSKVDTRLNEHGERIATIEAKD